MNRPKKKDDIKDPGEYEQVFKDHHDHLISSEHLSEREKIQLKIMDSGIFWRGMLKGRALSGGSPRKPKYKCYPLSSSGEIYTLLRELADQYIGDDVDEAVEDFYRAFKAIAKTARYAGVSKAQIDNIMKSWGEKVESKFESDGPPEWWYSRSGPEVRSLPLHERLAFTLVYRLPESEIPHARIANWVNIILETLGEERVPDRTLRGFIKDNREKWKTYQRPLFGPGTFF